MTQNQADLSVWSASDKLERDHNMSDASRESNACPSRESETLRSDARMSSIIPSAAGLSMGSRDEIVRPGNRFRIRRYSRFKHFGIIAVFLVFALAISVDVFANTPTGYHRAPSVRDSPCSQSCPQLLLLVRLYVGAYLGVLALMPLLLGAEESSERSGEAGRHDLTAID